MSRLWVLWVMAAIGLSNPVAAKDFDRLSDGRVVIEIGQTKIALAAHDQYLKDTVFYFTPDIIKLFPNNKNVMYVTLGTFLASPEIARKAIELSGGVSVYLGIQDSYTEGNTLFQDKWPFKDLADIFGDSYMISVTKNKGNVYPEAACSSPLRMIPYENGYINEDSKFDPSWQRLCLPAEKRLFKTAQNVRLDCNDYNGGNHYHCKSTLFNYHPYIRAYYAFTGFKQSNGIGFPPDQWALLDKRMRDAFAYVVISNPEGPLQ